MADSHGEGNKRQDIQINGVVNGKPQKDQKKETPDISPTKSKIHKHIELDRLLNQDEEIKVQSPTKQSKFTSYKTSNPKPIFAQITQPNKTQKNINIVSKNPFNYSEIVPSQNSMMVNIAEPIQMQNEIRELQDNFNRTTKKVKYQKLDYKKQIMGASKQSVRLPTFFELTNDTMQLSMKKSVISSNQQTHVKQKQTLKDHKTLERQILQDYQLRPAQLQFESDQLRVKAMQNAPKIEIPAFELQRPSSINKGIMSAYQIKPQTVDLKTGNTKNRLPSSTKSTSPTIQRLPFSKISDSTSNSYLKVGMTSMINSSQKLGSLLPQTNQTDQNPTVSQFATKSYSISSLSTPKTTQFLPSKHQSAEKSILVRYSSQKIEQASKSKYSKSFNIPDTNPEQPKLPLTTKKYYIKIPNKIGRSHSQATQQPLEEQRVEQIVAGINPVKRKEQIIQRIKKYSEKNLSQLGTQSQKIVFSGEMGTPNWKILSQKGEQNQNLPIIQRPPSIDNSLNSKDQPQVIYEQDSQIMKPRSSSAEKIIPARKFIKIGTSSQSNQMSENGSNQSLPYIGQRKLKIVQRLLSAQKSKIELSSTMSFVHIQSSSVGQSVKLEQVVPVQKASNNLIVQPQVIEKSQSINIQLNRFQQGPGQLIQSINKVNTNEIKNNKYQIKHNILASVPSPRQFGKLEALNMSKDIMNDNLAIKLLDRSPKTKITSSLVKSPLKKDSTKQLKTLNVIDERRIDTQTSAVTDKNLSPKSRILQKLQRGICINFGKYGQPPETQCENYKIGKVMGKGAFGKVNLAIHRFSGKFVALKSINKQFMTEETSKRKVMQEFNILRLTCHENIVRLYEQFETPQHIVFVMEVCGGGDLLTYVRRRRKLKEEITRHIFRQVINGIRYCHSKQVIHRDIKLDNILLTSQGKVKICDFGVSKQLQRPNEKMFEQCGTPAYMAPEVFENKGYEGYQSDIWSAGVVLYTMLYGTVPFKASNINDLHVQVVKSKPDFDIGDEAERPSLQAIQLLKAILERDTSKRLTCDQILAHPWMNNSKNKVNVFTKDEKASILDEFEHYNQRKERKLTELDTLQNLNVDPFAEHLLQSTENSIMKNATSRSQILAPFNSTYDALEDASEISMNQSKVLKLMVPRRTIRFAPKVAEIDRQYEQNNNAALDNGVYHQDEEKDGGDCNDTKQSPNGNDGGIPTSTVLDHEKVLATSFDRNELESQLQELCEENSADSETLRNRNFELEQQELNQEWKKIENELNFDDKMINTINIVLIDDEKDQLGSQGLRSAAKQQPNSQASSFVNQNSQMQSRISKIQSFGYPEEFIIESLKQAKFNHVTAFYSLLSTKFEY